MRKAVDIAFSAVAYVLAMANIAYVVAFLADIGVPKTIASGEFDDNLWAAVAANVMLVLGFGLHHSITARRSFKQRWTHWVPARLERATYLYMTAVTTGLLVIAWQPIPITVWEVGAPAAKAMIHAGFVAVLLMMFAATFHFGHLDFFGLGPAIARARARQVRSQQLSARYLYALVRHPISLGWMLLPWLTPHLTVGHVVFGLSTVAYVLVATRFEEADLTAEFGDAYHRYRRRVPAFVPRLRRS